MVNGAGREDVIRVPMSGRVRRAKDRQEEESPRADRSC